MALKCVRLWLMLILMFISLQGWMTEGCLEQERSALLQLKHFFNDQFYLQNWVEGDRNSECCDWGGVECNKATGRVISLMLGYTRNQKLGGWYLNVSLFSPFQEVETLDFSSNLIAGCVENEGFERLSHLTNLVDLYLNDNMFNDSRVLSALSQHSSLKNLDLAYNQFRELNHFNVSRLSNLESLSLSGNMFNNNILSYVSILSSLKYLHLDDIRLKDTVDLQELDTLSNLEELTIGGKEIKKVVFSKGETNLRKLSILYLRNLSISDGSSLLQTLGLFPSLENVEFEYNNFSGAVTTYELHNFTNVGEFSFFDSTLHISFLRSIGAFTSLQSLYIDYCEVSGVLTDQELPAFKNLTYLKISDTIFNNNSLQMLGGMTSLEHLSISNYYLKNMLFDKGLPTVIDSTDLNNFIQNIGSLTSLTYLELSSFNVTKPVLEEGICNLVNLRELYMGDNDLGGTLPTCLANLTSLQVLDISLNHFIGNISSSPLTMLTSIQDLMLSDNHFRIPISLELFFNHSQLKNFYGGHNEIYAGFESDSLTPNFQLNSIIFSGYGDCNSFPKFLYHQHDLQKVDLSNINLKGKFPVWLLNNNTKLENLYLVNNSLSGSLQLPIYPHMSLKELDISINSFHEHIPTEIGAYLPMLESFNISRNAFEVSIPSSFGDMKLLVNLDLSNNLLTEGIPEHLVMGCISLQLLILSNNSLQGQIFSNNFNLTSLSILQLDGNNFTGKIPDSLFNSSLTELYIRDNHLIGTLPRWLGNKSYLKVIVMSNNHLEGPIPMEFCQLEHIEILDLSENNITGSVPFCFRPPLIRQIHLSKNKLQGQLNDAFSNSSSLMTLDLAYNHLEGNIPDWISRLSNLTYLILSNNQFQGKIPIQFCQLNQLRLLDLSHNNLYGNIPNCLNIMVVPANFTPLLVEVVGVSNASMRNEETIKFTTKSISYSYRGKVLNYMSGIDLSNNKLTGEIPRQIGDLVGIHTLNLSHNKLIGQIPSTFSNLKQIESLDLSYNNLNGTIPPGLVQLYTLAVFDVASNNLSGKIPDTAQFGTFGASSYEGNLLLCGQPLPKSCNATDSKSSMPKASIDNDEDGNFIDMYIFYISFAVSYTIVLLGIVAVLYVNPYWRRTWFYIVEMWMTSCYYFIVDHLPL